MKRILLAAALTLPLTAWADGPDTTQELVHNGDFADGVAGWEGDGKDASQAANDNAKNNDGLPNFNAPAAGQQHGLLITLKPDQWSHVRQVITLPTVHAKLVVTWNMTPGTTIQEGPMANIGMLHLVGPPAAFHTEGTGFYAFASNLDIHQKELLAIGPKNGVNQYTGIIGVGTPPETMALDFFVAPGQGSITITKISATPMH